MTKVLMMWNNLQLEMEGHANAGEIGKDIVCAAESILVQALIRTLENAEKRGRTKLFLDSKEDAMGRLTGGSVKVRADPGMGNRAEIKSYFRFCVTGLKEIAKEYPKNVQVREVG